jgi:hypothetical protein
VLKLTYDLYIGRAKGLATLLVWTTVSFINPLTPGQYAIIKPQQNTTMVHLGRQMAVLIWRPVLWEENDGDLVPETSF